MTFKEYYEKRHGVRYPAENGEHFAFALMRVADTLSDYVGEMLDERRIAEVTENQVKDDHLVAEINRLQGENLKLRNDLAEVRRIKDLLARRIEWMENACFGNLDNVDIGEIIDPA